ncbi:MAG: hypothetical protein HONBIEJF_01065 [Fimbriimonadaceae bacterium]|nr:hypothetical protein [Fimbriimonadaceae bacterium]
MSLGKEIPFVCKNAPMHLSLGLLILGLAGSLILDQVPSLPKPDEFRKWPSVTKDPIPVSRLLLRLCRDTVKDYEELRKRHGPHTEETIRVRVKGMDVKNFRKGRPAPVGSIVVKEKFSSTRYSSELVAYGIMIKREIGYDAPNGDWEYAYVSTQARSAPSRGRLSTCRNCHAGAKGSDYLFRGYQFRPIGLNAATRFFRIHSWRRSVSTVG